MRARKATPISRRIAMMNLAVSIATLALACVGFFIFDVISIRDGIVRNVASQAQIIATNSTAPLIFNDPDAATKTLEGLRSSTNVVSASIFTPDGTRFAQYGRQDVLPPLRIHIDGTESHVFTRKTLTLAKAITSDGKPIGTLYLVSDLRAMNRRLVRYGLISLALIGASMLAGLLVSSAVRKSIADPIVSLAETAQQVSDEKNYSIRASAAATSGEIAELVEAFNEMLQQIQSQQAALRELANVADATVQSIPQLVWRTNADSSVLFYNQRWFDYTGMSQDATYDAWMSYVHPDDRERTLDAWTRSRASGEPYRVQHRIRGRDGQYRWFFTHAIPVRDESGAITKWFGTGTDIHEQKMAEDALIRAEKLAATGRMAATVAHEINNPLAAITNAVHLLRSSSTGTEAELLSIVAEEVARVNHIVKSTLGLSRQNVIATDIVASRLVSDVLVLYEKRLASRNIRVVRSQDDGDMTIHVVANEIRQVISNLLTNALDVLGNDGVLRISVRRARGANGQDGVRITVADSGPGIPAQLRGKIFEPFFSTKADMGTGLGLWVSKNIIEKHGGTLRFHSATGEQRHGAAFSIFLPVSRLAQETVA